MIRSWREIWLSFGLLLLRLGAGSLLFGAHGLRKVIAFQTMTSRFSDPLGVGSQTSLMLAIFAEIVCSALVMLGLLTRVACVPIVVTMAVAALVVNAANPWADKELALIYAVPFIALIFTGPGSYSLDAAIARKRPRPVMEW